VRHHQESADWFFIDLPTRSKSKNSGDRRVVRSRARNNKIKPTLGCGPAVLCGRFACRKAQTREDSDESEMARRRRHFSSSGLRFWAAVQAARLNSRSSGARMISAWTPPSRPFDRRSCACAKFDIGHNGAERIDGMRCPVRRKRLPEDHSVPAGLMEQTQRPGVIGWEWRE
jgi:hypothetical protein